MPKDNCGEPEKPEESPEKDTWGEDQIERSYYYDDAHGYETYVEEEDDDDEEERLPEKQNLGADDDLEAL